MANSAIDSGVVELAERLGADRKVDRERMTAIETSVSELSNTVNTKESNLQKQIDTNKSAIIAGDSTTLESAKEYSDSQLSIHDASNESHSYIQGNVSGVDNRVGGIENLLNGVMYEDNIVEGTDYTKIVDVDNVAGSGTVKSYGGKTVVWNQLIQISRNVSNEVPSTDYGVTLSSSINNQSITLSGTTIGFNSGDPNFYNTGVSAFVGITNHRYLLKNSGSKNFLLYIFGSYIEYPSSTSDSNSIVKCIANGKISVSVRPRVGGSVIPSGSGIIGGITINETLKVSIFDLTLMFGAGNEPSTVEEFEAMFPADYYEYNAGELLSAGVQEVQSVGKNLVDFTQKKEFGNVNVTIIDNIVRVATIDTTTYRSADIRLDELEHYAGKQVTLSAKWTSSSSNTGAVRLQWMTNYALAVGSSIELKTSGSSVIGILPSKPANGYHLYLLIYANSNGTGFEVGAYVDYEYVQVEFGDTATDYAPYKESSLPIPTTVQALEGYGWSAGSAKNWVDWEKKIYHREVGLKDLSGVVYYGAVSDNYPHGFFAVQALDRKWGSYNVICNKYSFGGSFKKDKCIFGNSGGGEIYIIDSAYSDVDSFKNANSDIVIYYELATPELIDISNILPSNNTLPIETGGTITFKNSHGNDYRLPVPNTLNLPTKIDQFGNTLNSAKDYSDTLLTESKSFTTKTSLERAIEAHYALQRTGKLYQVKIPLYDINPTIECIKTLDNEGLVCEPSTDSVEGRDDYADIPLFQWVYCNYIRDDDGTPRPISIEGMDDFKLTGSVDVGVMQMSFYGKMEQDDEYQILTISDMPHPELGLIPWKNCVDSTGKVLPWNIYSAFQVVTADDGLYRSQPNKAPGYKFSHNNMITYFQKKGKGYWGGTADRNAFQRIFTLIKYAKKSSQAVFAGCTGYSFQHTVSVAESDVKRVIVTTSQGNSYVVGQCVSVGESYNGTSNDRSYDILHSIADRVLVTAKENVTIDDTEYTAIYLDVPENFTTTSTSVVSSMPCYTGQTMKVKGHHDGSITSNTNSYYGYRVQGVEYAIGQWIVASDTVGYLNDALTKPSLVYVAPRGLAHSSTESVIKSTYTVAGEMTINLNADSTNRVDAPIGDVGLIDFANGVIYPTVKGTSTANGVGDYFYQGGASLNTCREWLMAGSLYRWSYAGSAFLALGVGLGHAYWYYGAAD